MTGKKVQKNNVTTTLNVLYAKKRKSIFCLVSKHISNCKIQVV